MKKLICLLCVINLINTAYAAEIIQKQNLDQPIKIVFQWGGGYSPYKFINLEINEKGQAQCNYAKFSNEQEVKIDYFVSNHFLNKLIDIFKSKKFLNITQDAVDSMERPVLDVGKTTIIYYENNELKKKLSYIDIEEETLNSISSLCWKVINKGIYIHSLQKAIKTGDSFEDISPLQYDIATDGVADPEELMPLLIEIVANEKLRDIGGGYAVRCISALTGLKIDWVDSKPPSDNTKSAGELLKWWEKNRNKTREEWLKINTP